MVGFTLVFNRDAFAARTLNNSRTISGEAFSCTYSLLDKFQDDRIVLDTDTHFFMIDGIVFNKEEFISEKCADWRDSCLKVIVDHGVDQFLDKVRGNFCGAVYYKKEGRVIAFTDLVGEKALYYHSDNGKLIITSHMGLMKELLTHYGVRITPNIQACYEMLVTGSFLHGNSFAENVFRLMGGCYLAFDLSGLHIHRYHLFYNLPEWKLSLDECIERADCLFRKAVKRICDKNREYGYDFEVDLSGGLDSRLVTWAVHDAGYQNVLNVCWCQSGKTDNVSSRKISRFLKNDYYFYPMDGGEFLKDVDRMTQVTGGQILYTSSTCANRIFCGLDLHNTGMAVTGLLGELHNAYWTEGLVHTAPKYKTFYTNAVDIHIPEAYSEGYANYEQMNLYELSGLTFMSSAFTRQQFVEVCSPFIDRDFLEFAYRIPLKWRKNDFFTLNWIVRKFPDASRFVWQHSMKPIDKSLDNSLYFPKIFWDLEKNLIRLYNKICRMAKIKSQMTFRNDMNPFEKWYLTNKTIKQFYENYYKDNICLIEDNNLRTDVGKMMGTGKCYDAMLAVNLLADFKYYMSDMII